MSRKLVKELLLDEPIDTDGGLQINNVQFLKPTSDYVLNLSVMMYDSPEMTQPVVQPFDSIRPECSAYIEALLVNNTSNSNATGTQWMKPLGGFGTEYNNAPAVVHLHDWLVSMPSYSAQIDEISNIECMYLCYVWYFVDENNVIHKSDMYSQVVPANTEQTAHLSANAQQQLKQTVFGNVNTASFNDGKFIALPDVLNVADSPMFMDDANEDRNVVQLKDYSQGHIYDIKFSVAGAQQLQLEFADDVGLSISSIDTSQLELIPERSYVIRIYAGFAKVLHEVTS